MRGANAVRAATWASDHWRATTVLPLAEALLSHAALVREANVLCAQLGVPLRVQLGVQRAAPAGQWYSPHDSDQVLPLDEYAHEQPPALPRAIVRVFDWDAGTLYIWSLAHLRRQVAVLQRLNRLAPRTHDADVRIELLGLGTAAPHVAVATVYVPWQHGHWDTVSLRPVHGVPTTATCRVQAHVLRTHRACRIQIDQLVWDAALATELHWHAAYGTQSYATQPKQLALHPIMDVRFQRTLVAPEDSIPTGVHLTLFARPTRAFLALLEAHDQAVEQAICERGSDLALAGAWPHGHRARIHERYRRWATSLGVLVRVCATETHRGGLRPVRVQRTAPPTWALSSAAPVLLSVLLQTEAHELPHGLHIHKVYMSDVDTVDASGACHSHDSRRIVLQRLASPAAPLGAWRVDAVWDPCVHDHVPPVHHRLVRATLCLVLASPDMEPVYCAVPLWCRLPTTPAVAPAAWVPPDERRMHTVDHVFRLTLTPQPVRSPSALWHVDTRDVQVPGGEALRAWHVRGLSLVRDVLVDQAYERHLDEAVRHDCYPPPPTKAPDAFDMVRGLSNTATGSLGRPTSYRCTVMVWSYGAHMPWRCRFAGLALDRGPAHGDVDTLLVRAVCALPPPTHVA